jgi:hypothetical protein
LTPNVPLVGSSPGPVVVSGAVAIETARDAGAGEASGTGLLVGVQHLEWARDCWHQHCSQGHRHLCCCSDQL